MRKVVVLGGGMSAFGKQKEKSSTELGIEAARNAFKYAGIGPKDIQFMCCSELFAKAVPGEILASKIGIAGIEVVNVENACVGGSTAIHEAWLRIGCGICDIALVVGMESMTNSPDIGKLLVPPKEDLEGRIGMSMPAVFALNAMRHMSLYGTTREQFAMVSVKNHHHGCLNPYAMYHKEFTAEEVMNSRMIVDPITLLEAAPNADGAAAVILCSEEVAHRHTVKPVFIGASVLNMGGYQYQRKEMAFGDMTAKAAQEAYEMAGCGPEDLDLIELHEPFACAEIAHYEELGLCTPGEGGRLVSDGVTALGGRIPVNPSGGLLSQGHPLSATGVRQIVEIMWHLRDEAGDRQAKNAKLGLAHLVGGSVTGLESAAVSIHILYT